jgi:hypothetical protein
VAIGVNWKEVWGPVWGAVWVNTPPVTVPDVVGQSQASGTAELEGDGFVVAVATAYSSTVAAGDIISQAPTAGSSALSGSTVTITVSLGEAPVTDTNSGGFYFGYDRVRAERLRRKKELDEQREEQERIEDEQAREIARLMRAQEQKDAERQDLERLQALADRYAGQAMREGVSRRASAAILNAAEARTRNALEQMQREIERMYEEEEAALVAALLMDDD